MNTLFALLQIPRQDDALPEGKELRGGADTGQSSHRQFAQGLAMDESGLIIYLQPDPGCPRFYGAFFNFQFLTVPR